MPGNLTIDFSILYSIINVLAVASVFSAYTFGSASLSLLTESLSPSEDREADTEVHASE